MRIVTGLLIVAVAVVVAVVGLVLVPMYEAKAMGKGCIVIFDPKTTMGGAS